MLTLFLSCFLLGCVTGLRSLTAPAAVCWGAYLDWLHLGGTRLAFMGRSAALIVFTLLALFELINDKLPKTPARTALPGLSARVLMGAFCGSALAVSAGGSLIGAAISGIVGALAGTFGGSTFATPWLRKSICRTSQWLWLKTSLRSRVAF